MPLITLDRLMLRQFDPARMRSVVVVAALLGMLGGLFSSLVLTATGQPLLEDALVIEESRRDPDAPVLDELVSRDVQRGIGRFGAYALAGAAFGVFFAVAFVALRRRVPDPFRRALVTGGILAGAVTASPWLKYPPNPPAVGDPDTATYRQRLYFIVIVATFAVLVGAVHLLGRLRAAGWSEHRRLAAVVVSVVAVLSAVYALLPGAPDPVPMPATLIWRYRLASLSGNLVLWAVLTLGFGLAAATHAQREMEERSVSPSR